MEEALHHYHPHALQDNNIFHQAPPHTLPSQFDLDPNDPFQFNAQFDVQSPIPQPQTRNNVLDPSLQHPRFHDIQPQQQLQPAPARPRPASSRPQGGQFGILTPHNQLPNNLQVQHEPFGRFQGENDLRSSADGSGATTHFGNLKVIPDPPDLEAWRERLFSVNEPIDLTEEELQTYFPHVDNIYSHRSTQKYKRKPFVSHYWDCRLKGRPPGTAKSDDPNKKKRKRQARERDLCDVKIKITEFFPGARAAMGESDSGVSQPGTNNLFGPAQPGASMLSDGTFRTGPPGADGSRYYTIQRVNSSNGQADGAGGGHKHTLDESDRVKRNSIQRHMLKEEKVKRKFQKTYHKRATGSALSTVKKRSKDHDLKLIGSCFCPFVQRVWISMEIKKLDYQYIEVDPYKKPDWLLDINPRGLIPALRHGDWSCYESTVLMEYLEDLNEGKALLPKDPKIRAHSRLWTDHINRHIVPVFYQYLQAQDSQKQIDAAEDLKLQISKLIDAADPSGPFFLGPNISFVDIQMAPWVIRMRRVLKPYRGWPDPEPGTRWATWVDAIERNEGVKATTSGDELYLDSYERYAENRPDTSQVANAVNSGRGLP